MAGGPAAVGDCRRATRRAVQLPGQRHVLVCTDRRSGIARDERSAIRQTRLLDVAAHLRGPGDPVRRAHHARPVHDAAVHAALAELVDRPAHRRLARRSRLLPHPVHRPTPSTTPTSASRPISTSSPPASIRNRTRPNNSTKSTLLFGAVDAVVSVISFTAILWNLSGQLTMPIVGITMPRAMFWIGLALRASSRPIIAFWIGRPIIRLSFDNEKFNAAFRYALVRLRDAAEAVAFYRGEAAERLQLRRRFAPVVHELQALHQPDDEVQRLEPVDQPDHRAAALAVSGAAAVRPADQVGRRHAVRRRRSARSRTDCRSSATSTTASPAGARRSSVCTGSWSSNEEGRALPKLDSHRQQGRAWSNSTTSRSAHRTASS